ncbi:hypothetical protein FOA52_011315 [Chlamydomonas sp. UWO 241]|nr:hypothetical protein FOA52_011315 [Chlamydomonas sp. UWO 241]
MLAVNGTRVVESGTALGRVVVATREFEAREVVLAEPAALVWLKEGGPTSLLRAFSRAEGDTQVAVLEMFHPALGSEAASAVLKRSHQLLLRALHEVQVPLEIAQKLELIANFNAHAFLGRTDTPSSSEVMLAPGGAEAKPKHLALYVIGSKVEHSCLPNMSYSSKTGQLVYTAVRLIAAGDRISFAYMPTSEQDTQERRELLLTDGVALRTSPAEGIRSSATGDSPALLMAQLKMGAGATWTCLSCNAHATDAEMGAAIKKEALLLADVKQRKAISSVQPGMVRAAQQQQLRYHSALPPMHHLHARCSELVSFLTASEANMVKGCPPSMVATMVRSGTMLPVKQLQWEAAVSAVELILWRERSKAMLLGRMQPQATWEPGAAASKRGLSPQARLAHIVGTVWSGSDEAAALQPCWDSAKEIFFAGMDLVEAGAASDAAPIFRCYLDIMFAWMSLDDDDRWRNRDVLDRFPAKH